MLVASLASGSAGNALLVRVGDEVVLIDAGLSLRAIEQRIPWCGVAPSQVRAILLTHEHTDHALSAVAFARRYQVPLVANAATLAALGKTAATVPHEVLPVAEQGALGVFTVQSFRIAHDAAEAVGYRITASGVVLAVAVDLGSWDETTVAALSHANLIVVEANHDRAQLATAPYPLMVRQRISGPLGHLDNIQCGRLLAQVARRGMGNEVWLAHLSHHANTPHTALAEVQDELRRSGVKTPLRLRPLPRCTRLESGGLPVWQAAMRWVQSDLFDEY